MDGTIKGHVGWSIYVRTANLRKLKASHLPAISVALEHIEFDWKIMTEDDNPGLFRLINYQNFEVVSVEDAIIPVLRRAYKLANTWNISGLEDLATEQLQHVYGKCDHPPNANQAPALDSLVFEIELGHILRISADGGWPVVDLPPISEPEKERQIRRPAPPDKQ